MKVLKKYLFRGASLTKSSALLLFSLLFLGILIPLGSVHAGFPNPFSWGADFVMNAVVLYITLIPALVFMFALQLILTISSFLVFLSGFILEIVINLDIPFTHCPQNTACFLDSAWTLMRDLVNMLLIIILVVIAFATMLRWEGYGFKKALVPLIAVALLVNFSKVIVGTVVDISTIVMQIFLNDITGLGAFTNSLSAQGDLLKNQILGLKFLTLSGNISFILKTLALIAFQLGFAFLLGLYAIIFLVRYVALWLITILSPFALAAFILPSTKKFFTMWRDQLISWSFIGVTAGFFLWLSTFFLSDIEQYTAAFQLVTDIPSGNSRDVPEAFIVGLLPYMLLLIFLYIAFTLALKTNAMGSSFITKRGGALAGTLGTIGAAKVTKGLWKRSRNQWTPWIKSKGGQALRPVGGVASRIPGAGRAGAVMARPAKWADKAFRNKYAGTAAKVLGGGAARARRLATVPFKHLSKKEKKAILDAVLYGRRRGASKDKIDKKRLEEAGMSQEEIEKFQEYEERRLEEEDRGGEEGGGRVGPRPSPPPTSPGEETSPAGTTPPPPTGTGKRYTEKPMDSREEAERAEEARRKGEEMKTAMEKTNEEIDKVYKSIENFAQTQIDNLARTGSDIERVAAALRLADKQTLGDSLSLNEQGNLVDQARKVGREHSILKRYIHLAGDEEIEDVMKKMTKADHQQVNKKLFDPENSAKFKTYYKNLNVEGFEESRKNDELRGAWDRKVLMDSDFETTDNPQIHNHVVKNQGRIYAFWPKGPLLEGRPMGPTGSTRPPTPPSPPTQT